MSPAELPSRSGEANTRGITAARAAIICALSVILVYFSRLPLAHIDLWGHLAWGRWIVEHRRLPATEPFMPLVKGVPVVDTAWLSQVAGYAVHSIAGPTGLQFLHGLAVAASCAVLLGAIGQRTQCLVALLAGLATLVLTQWFQWQIIRPQTAGQLSFAALIFLLVVRKDKRPTSGLVAALYVFWANSHGSFIIGLMMMALMATGRAVDLWIAGMRSIREIVRDEQLHRLALLGLLSAAAALLNPYGPGLYREVAQFSGNPNLRDLLEWAPLSFSTWQGRLFGFVAVVLVLLKLITRRSFRFQEGLPLIVLGAAVILSARFIVWWGPLAACATAAAIDELLQRAAVREKPRPVRSRRWTAGAALALALGCALTPFVRRIVTGREPPLEQTVSRRTPIGSTEWFRLRPPKGLLFNSYEWGDYLVWAGPAEIEVFVTSHVHVIPPPVWRDYRSISTASEGWQARLDHYSVQTAIVDLARHPRLARAMSDSDAWEQVYRDRQAVIFTRRG